MKIENFVQISGRKVLLRPFSKSDITPEYISWLNDPVVVKYSNQKFVAHTHASCLEYWNSFLNTSNLFVSIRTLADNLPVGTMTAYVSREHEKVDIGILIGRRSVWGTGVGQDAWDTLLNWFLLQRQIRKVTAGTLSTNKAMLRIMNKSGMHCQRVAPSSALFDGQHVDVHYYEKYNHTLR